MTERAWAHVVDRTGLGDPDHRRRLDRRVRGWLGQRRGLSGSALESVAAYTVERAHSEILRLGEHSLWLPCSTSLALAGELILGAKSASILSNAVDEWNQRIDEQAWIDVHAINNLRNVFCHPACPPVDELTRHIRREGEERELAALIDRDWTALGTRRVAEYSLRKLDAVGRHAMHRWGI